MSAALSSGRGPGFSVPQRLGVLAVKRGLSLAILGEADRALLLACAACTLSAGCEYREAEVNRALAAWLEGAGAMLRTDHVELRRWLVDSGLLWRDGYGRVYRRGPEQSARSAAIVGDAPTEALESALTTARLLAAENREARRRAFEASP